MKWPFRNVPTLMYGFACALAGAHCEAIGLPWSAVVPMAMVLGFGAHLAASWTRNQ